MDGTQTPYRTPKHHARVLPLRVIWPGFALNTLFYATLLWLLFTTPGTMRRRLRIRRNLCPDCAYPIGNNSICTECGKPVATTTASR
ncbi:MAG: hypothetical protein L0Y44_08360 [Phycisphaerales bacterium]|nr:hypothetical protein [Phycisphaerales bacterium]